MYRYGNAKLCVKVNNKRSNFFGSGTGVRQSDNLSPNLFNLYISDLPEYFDNTCDSVPIS